jgi:hypothetical protein
MTNIDYYFIKTNYFLNNNKKLVIFNRTQNDMSP